MTVLVAGPQVPSMKFPKSGTNGRPDAVTSNRPCNIREDEGKCAESARQIYWLLAMTDSNKSVVVRLLSAFQRRQRPPSQD